MNIRTLLASFAICVAAVAAVFAQTGPAQPAAPAAAPGGAAPGGGRGPQGPQAPKTEIEQQMQKINENVRALNTQIADMAKKDDSVTKLTEIRAAFVEAAKHSPKYLAAIPEENKKKFLADYDATLKKELAAVDTTIAALKAGNSEGAVAGLQTMKDIQMKEGHAQFRAPRGGRGPGGPGGAGGAAGGPPGPQPQGAPSAAPRGN